MSTAGRPAGGQVGVPRVSVLISAYNAGPFVAAALKSIFGQTFGDFEIVLMDDGSRDETPAVVERFTDPRLRYIRSETNAGLPRRLNEGLALARGEYIARLDADDIAHPERLARQVAALDADPQLAMIGSNKVNITQTGRYLSGHYNGVTENEVLWQSCLDAAFTHSAVTYRRSILWERLGGYRDIPHCEDIEMWGRLLRAGYRARNLPDVLVAYRHHGGQLINKMQELRVQLTADVNSANLEYVLPRRNPGDLRRVGRLIADVKLGWRPFTPEVVREVMRCFREFVQERGISARSLRHVQATTFLIWGSFAKRVDPMRAVLYGIRAMMLSPTRLDQLSLPQSVREVLASRLGRFWEPLAATSTQGG